MTSPDSRAEPGLPTIGDALDVAGGALTLLGGAAAQASTAFSAVRFFEPSASASEYRDCIVLGAGLAPADIGRTQALLARAGAAALVVRLPDGDDEVAPMSEPATIGYPEGDWAQLANTVRSLLGEYSAGRVTGVRPGDLFGLANALATLAEGAVSIVDSTGQIVGYSTLPDQPIDDIRRRTTLLLQEEGPLAGDPDYQTILRAPAAMHFPASDDQFGRVSIAVRAAGELLGTIWVIQVDPGNAARTRALLDEMAPIAAQHLLRARDNAAERDRRNSELLRALCEDERQARSAASQLLIRPDAGCTVVCFRVDTFDEVAAVRGLHRLLHLAMSVAGSTFSGAHSAVIGPQVVTLIPGSAAARVQAFAQSVIRTDGALVAGIGTRVHELSAIARSYREAVATAGLLMSAYAVVDAGRSTRLATFDDVRDVLAVQQVADLMEGLDVAVGDAASRLFEHDRRQGTELARTMLTYLNLHGSVRETAVALHVHQNTVRYRLDLVRNELGIDLDSPGARLWLWLRLFTSTARPAETGTPQ